MSKTIKCNEKYNTVLCAFTIICNNLVVAYVCSSMTWSFIVVLGCFGGKGFLYYFFLTTTGVMGQCSNKDEILHFTLGISVGTNT